MTKLTKIEYLQALDKAHEDPESYKIIEHLIADYLGMIRHMKETSLMDVLEYEELLTKRLVEPFEMLVFENKQLKKKVNRLRKQLDLCEEYKED